MFKCVSPSQNTCWTRWSLLLVRLVDSQGAGWRVNGVDKAWHPVMGQPGGAAWVVLLKHLSEVVGLFGAWRVVTERLVSLLHLLIIDLRANREQVRCRNKIWALALLPHLFRPTKIPFRDRELGVMGFLAPVSLATIYGHVPNSMFDSRQVDLSLH